MPKGEGRVFWGIPYPLDTLHPHIPYLLVNLPPIPYPGYPTPGYPTFLDTLTPQIPYLLNTLPPWISSLLATLPRIPYPQIPFPWITYPLDTLPKDTLPPGYPTPFPQKGHRIRDQEGTWHQKYPPPPMNRQMPVKTLPSSNYCCGWLLISEKKDM